MRKATIVDVAERAGVSWKTVARVVNNEPGIKAANVARVREAVAALGYRPNRAAKSLKSQKSYLIGLLTVAAGAHYLLPFSRGAAAICRERGYHLLLEHLELTDLDLPGLVDSILHSGAFHAMILPPPFCNDPEVVACVLRHGVRALLIDPIVHDPSVPHICVDDEPGVKALVAHAIESGHTRFALIEGDMRHRAALKRRDAYLTALAERGHENVLRIPGDFTFASGFSAGKLLFEQGVEPTFVFAANDDMAAGVMAAAVRAGRRIPDDVSVAGFDDSDVAQQVWPFLTTIHQPIASIGAAAVDILTRPVEEADRVANMFSVSLVVRGSTGPVAKSLDEAI
jgi:LacI family transcriptional regulator